MLKKVTIFLCALALLVGLYAVTAAADATSAVAAIGTEYFDTLEAAVAAVDASNPGEAVITLRKDVATARIDKTVYLNLAGKNIASVDVAEGVTLYCLDSETDDYDIDGDATNGFSGFGRIAAVTGKGKVAGVEAGMIPVEPTEEYRNGCLDGYLMVEEDNGLSFHRVNLQITAMTLRAQEDGAAEVNPSVYYKSAFAGDALVAENVKTFGIALSVQEEPNAGNMGITNAYSWFEGADFNAGENNNNATSTLLKGVMKESNADLRNKTNANMPIYGKAYIQTENNEYVFGICVDRTLKQQTEAANQNWSDYDADKQATLTAMYDTYYKIMKSWSIEDIVEGYEAEEAKVLKVLTLGHSLGLDSNHMLNLIADSQGIKQYDEMVIGSLYYSGCPLWRHAGNLYDHDPEYSLHLSSTADVSVPLQSIPNVTIAYAIDYDYWDIIIMQGGVWEIGQDDKYLDGNIQIIQNYIEKNKRNPELYLGWNMTWCPPVDDELTNDSYKTNYTNYFNRDRAWMYENVTRCVQSYIATDDHYKFIVPAATIFENALTSYLTEKDIHRDYVHATDLTRVMVSHAFYCRIFGIEQLDEIKLDVVPTAFFKTHNASDGDWVLTDAEKALILEAVNNALKTPFAITQSQYTEAQ